MNKGVILHANSSANWQARLVGKPIDLEETELYYRIANTTHNQQVFHDINMTHLLNELSQGKLFVYNPRVLLLEEGDGINEQIAPFLLRRGEG